MNLNHFKVRNIVSLYCILKLNFLNTFLKALNGVILKNYENENSSRILKCNFRGAYKQK